MFRPYALLSFASLLAAAIVAPVRADATTKPATPAVELRGHGGRGVAFSGNGARVVTWGDRSAQVWDVATGKTVGPAVKHDGDLTAASLDAEGEQLLTASSISAAVADVATGKQLQSFWHDAEVTSATFDSKGGRVLTAGGGNVRLWEAKTGERVWIAQHARHLHGAAFAANDARVLGFAYEGDGAGGGRDRKPWAVSAQALVWDAGDGRLLAEHDVDLRPDEFSSGDPVHPAAVSPDGSRVASRTFLGLAIRDSAGRHQIERHTWCNDQSAHQYSVVGGSPTWLAYRPDGKALLTMGGLANAFLWDADLKGEPTVLEALNDDPWESAAFVAGGSRLAASGRRAGVVVVDLSSKKAVFRSPKPSKEDAKTTRTAVSADGRYVAMTNPTRGLTSVWEVPPPAKE